MARGRRDGDAPDPGRKAGRSVPNEDGLRALGSQAARPSKAQQANEDRLVAPGATSRPPAAATPSRPAGAAPQAPHRLRGPRGAGRPPRRRRLRLRPLPLRSAPKAHITAEKQEISGQPFNILVIGSDSRVGDPGSAFGQATIVTGQRSDVIMIWHVDPASKQISILSIPRDTLVTMDADQSEFGNQNRINASYNDGANCWSRPSRTTSGSRSTTWLQVDFGGFKGRGRRGRRGLDGLQVPGQGRLLGAQHHRVPVASCSTVHRRWPWPAAATTSTSPWATGTPTATGDFGRIERQDAFLRSLIDAAKSKYNPLTLNAFLGSSPQGVVIDDQLTLNDLIGLAEDFTASRSTPWSSQDAAPSPRSCTLVHRGRASSSWTSRLNPAASGLGLRRSAIDLAARPPLKRESPDFTATPAVTTHSSGCGNGHTLRTARAAVSRPRPPRRRPPRHPPLAYCAPLPGAARTGGACRGPRPLAREPLGQGVPD